MAKDLAKEIANAQQQIASIQVKVVRCRQQMGSVRQKFIGATAEFLSSWCMQEVERRVKEKADLTEALDGEPLSRLKDEVRQLESTMPGIVTDIVNAGQYWQVRTAEAKQAPFPCYTTTPLQLVRAVGLAAGHLAPILVRYEYLSSTDWHDIKTGQDDPPNAGYCLDLRPWSEDMNKAWEEYESLAKECYSLSEEIETLEQRRAEDRASDSWEHA